tara:strand:+ start:9679 stop:10587 length:909 start_codon:yes stop_codon:yes gene_type:complete
MKALIIGYGSIGQRHHEVLSLLNIFNEINVVTKRQINNVKSYSSLYSVDNLDTYDYFVISSETNKHFEQLSFLENNLFNKLIFCEKPLFETRKTLQIERNKVFVGYVLRFHPLLLKLKSLVRNETIIYANVSCGQYLPSWRPDSDYRNCYSAYKEQGGGVLLDLSHEIDYVQWLCGSISELKSYQVHQSDLEIDSDDLAVIIGKTTESTMINLSIDYISKITHRSIRIETLKKTITVDLIDNLLTEKCKNGYYEELSLTEIERNHTYESMHRDILGFQEYACSFEEGQKVMETIYLVQEQNK